MAQQAARERLRQVRREACRQHLIEAAERVFARAGYDETRMQDVAQEAGLALATVYDLVPSKEQLYAEIFRLRGRALLERALQAQAGARTAMDVLLGGIQGYVEFLCEHPDYLRIQLRERQPWALAPRFNSEEQRRLWQEGINLATGVFRAVMAEAALPEEDPETLARLMIAAHQVYLARWLEQGGQEPVPRLVRRMQRHVVRTLGAPLPDG